MPFFTGSVVKSQFKNSRKFFWHTQQLNRLSHFSFESYLIVFSRDEATQQATVCLMACLNSFLYSCFSA